ncbi:MAG: hypothetical protein ACO3AG_00800 [Fluviibacter sp.]
MIEYFHHFTHHKNMNVCILIADGLTREQFSTALEKYDFTEDELKLIHERTFFHYKPLTVIAKTFLITNGSMRFCGADLLVDKIVMFRCNDTDGIEQADVLLQDYDIYEPTSNSIDYKKKILFSRFKKLTPKKPNIGMFYGTKNSRKMTYEQIDDIMKRTNFDSYLLLTDHQMEVPENCELRMVPIKDLWDSFGTYLYTNTSVLVDCSPRFVAECAHYGKGLEFYSDKIDLGLQTRMNDIKSGVIELKDTDVICSKI